MATIGVHVHANLGLLESTHISTCTPKVPNRFVLSHSVLQVLFTS